MRRFGFTLLEVMVAMVLTAVVALMAYAAAQASAETQVRLDTGLRMVRSDRSARQTLLDLLHNVRAPRQRGDTSFILQADTLWLVAAGVPPLDPEYDWLVKLHPGPEGLELSASSLGRTRSRVSFRMPRVSHWNVQVLAAGSAEWRRDWPQTAALPQGVALTFWDDSVPLGSPLYVRLSEVVGSSLVETEVSEE